jgi:HSP20 family protein
MNSLLKYNPKTKSLVDWGFDSFLDSFDRIFNEPYFAIEGKFPRVDVREEEGKYVLEAELPGLTEKDIDVKVDGNLLTISSAKNEEKESKKDGYLIKERKAYSFCRTFTLPEDVAKDKIEARFANGLLSLEMEKNPEAKPRQITVKTA